MAKIIDISLVLDEDTPIYPGNPDLKIKRTQTIEHDGCNVSELSMGCHTGTHIDSPWHFFDDGARAKDLPLDVLMGRAIVIEINDTESIKPPELGSALEKGYERVIFKTKNSGLIHSKNFQKDYVYLSAEAADYLVRNNVRLIGIDYLSINKFDSPEQETHKILLGNNVVIIEGLDLSNVEPGEYELIALPLKLPTDGSPSRVVLREIG
jgi:arylformamidase